VRYRPLPIRLGDLGWEAALDWVAGGRDNSLKPESGRCVPNAAVVRILKIVHDERMRTNITLDDDVHRLASIYANAKGIALGAAIGELIRKAEAATPPPPDIRRSANGLPCFPPTGKPLTMLTVKEAESAIE
jgi:hypothetical protein